MNYNYTQKIEGNFTEVKEILITKLSEKSFGILTEVDIQAVMKKKLDLDYDNYVILGVCNPTFAHQLLQEQHDIAVMLPCNIVVYEQNMEIYVSSILPSASIGMIENEKVRKIATEVEEILRDIIDGLSSTENTLHTCKACNLNYPEKCEKWCIKNNSCNLDIIKHAKK